METTFLFTIKPYESCISNIHNIGYQFNQRDCLEDIEINYFGNSKHFFIHAVDF